MNSTTRILILGLMIALISVPSAMALQDPYPMDGFVVYANGTTVAGANVTFTNQRTGEVIYDDSSAAGWYSNGADNFPSGYQDGDVIQYYTVFGEYTNTTTATVDVSIGHHTMNIILGTILDSDNDGVPDMWDLDNNTPAGYWTDSHGRGRLLGDMNGDGKLTSADALMILQAAVGKIDL